MKRPGFVPSSRFRVVSGGAMAAACASLVVLLVPACSNKSRLDILAVAPPPAAGLGSAVVLVENPPPGLDLRLSNGTSDTPAFDRTKLPAAKPLGAPEVAALLARTKPIAADPADRSAFALRPGSQPAPQTGQMITATFPAAAASLLPPGAADDGKDLQVLRYMPEGSVPLAPALTVTFSQPMVAVTSQADAAAITPVKLTPTPKGRWRWLGTRTLVFDPSPDQVGATGRFPQATTYQVEIPAGTKSAAGTELKAAVRFTFETPPMTLVQSAPGLGEPQPLDAPIFVRFDQKIDAQTVLARLRVTANGKPYATRQLSAAEVAKDDALRSLAAEAREAGRGNAVPDDTRWIAFRAIERFPSDALVTVEIPQGTPSSEGPNPTKTAQQFAFKTYAPLKLVDAQCAEQRECRPGMSFTFAFNNPLAAEKFAAAQVTVSPAIDKLRVIQRGATISVQGETKARTTYSITVAKDLLDEFGQTLGTPELRTFFVGDPRIEKTFYGPQGMVVLDPTAKQPTLDFFTRTYTQLQVKLYQVTPADYPAYATWMRERWKVLSPSLPGKKVFDGLVKTAAGAADQLAENHIDLMPAMNARGLGHVIAVVEPSPWTASYKAPQLVSWVQSTRLGLEAHIDQTDVVAFVTALDSGNPMSGVAVALDQLKGRGTTDARGLATFALPIDRTQSLVASKGDDVAFVLPSEYGGTWARSSPSNASVAWYVVDDRRMYKPGEEVALKGWLRRIEHGKHGDVVGVASPEQLSINYVVRDSRDNELLKGTAVVSAVGGFDTKFTLPKTPNLGYTRVELSIPGLSSYSHDLRVEEFRTPEFEVSARASQGPFLVGAGGDVTVNAKYYAGGALAGATVNWSVSARQTSFTPPNRDDYVFGNWQPWWGGGGYGGYDDDYYDDEEEGPRRGRSTAGRGGKRTERTSWLFEGKTDAIGAHTLHLDFLSMQPAMPMSVQTTASVTDVNRQAWSASSALVVHPAAFYVGLKSVRPFVEQGTPFDLDVIGVDLDGKAAIGAKIAVTASRLEYDYEDGEPKTKEVDPQACAITVARDAHPCHFATKQGGTYQVVATIVDPQGRSNQTKLTFWVSGGERPPARAVAQEEVQIIPDKTEYSPGNTAELLVQAPFYPAEGIVTWRRSGIVKTERITFTGPSKVITVPIEDAMTPNIIVQVDVVGMAMRADDKGLPDPKLPKRPAFAVGTIDLPVSRKLRVLNVVVTPAAAKVAPGEQTRLAVEVRDAAGQPVANAEAAVIVVDEAILALATYTHPDPIETFYPHRSGETRDHHIRRHVKLAKPERRADDLAPDEESDEEESGGTGTAMALDEGKMGKKDSARAEGQYKMRSRDGDGYLARDQAIEQARSAGVLGAVQLPDPKPDEPIAIRSNFNPLAAFAPVVKTDANGRATVELTMPDNLTRYRVVAIAVAGDRQYGKGESAVTARLPLMVRPSAPRFLNFGDTFRLPVVVQNQTDSPMTVKLAVRVTNAVLSAGAGREVVVPANDRVEVQFPAATELAGTARFQIVGTNGTASDAAEVAIPVWTPATTEAFATYGVIDEGAVKQPVALPDKVITRFGGLEITTASTNLQALTDAMLYLVHYPYDCAEQRSSRIIAIVALRDVLEAFKVPAMPSRAAMEASVREDVKHLSQLQNHDGGFSWWERGRESEPYLSVYVTNALARAKAKGYAVEPRVLEQGQRYLATIESRMLRDDWSRDARTAVSAYALYTRKLLGDLDIAKGKRLLADAGGVTKLTMEATGWLLGVFAGDASAVAERAAIVRHVVNKVSETAGAANFTTSYGDGAHLLLASDRRVDAVMLDALIQEQPSLDLIPKIVKGLLGHQKSGRWLNTQENTYALLALDRYFQTYEKTTPDFVARAWLGADYAGDHAFKGRTTEQFQIDIAMADVATHDKQALTIQKDGTGRLYYRVGMRYAPESLELTAADHGFVVARTYEGVDDPADVTRAADGVWHIKAGARVRVKLAIVNENRRYHVALVDPLPAGLEAMNPALAVTGPIPPGEEAAEAARGGRYWWWYRTWYEHQNMRDERVEAFTAFLYEGVHSYTYVARATTPGNFIVPPTKAEEMYMPETFGRSASDRVIVE